MCIEAQSICFEYLLKILRSILRVSASSPITWT